MARVIVYFIFLSGLITAMSNAVAQRLTSSLQQVIDTEMAFAKSAKEKTIKEAFLKYLSESSIVFANGEPVNGYAFWKERPASSGTMFWWPVLADISLAEDMAYTTGPYQMSKDQHSEPYSYGYYSTVWKKNVLGEWKIAIDLGIILEKGEEEKLPLRIPKVTKGRKAIASSTKEGLSFMEQSYTQWLNETGNSFLPEYFSKDCRIHRSGAWPYTTWKNIESIQEDRQFYFDPVNADISASGDMGYTYGKVKIERRDGSTENANYLRVWKREAETNWKIVLDVIGG